MRFTYLLTTLVASATGNPLGARSCTTGIGLPGAVYWCDQPLFAGNCGWLEPFNDCRAFDGPSLPVSIGPDLGGYCVTYTDTECQTPPIMYQDNVAFPQGTTYVEHRSERTFFT